jgi:hypothetical protein
MCGEQPAAGLEDAPQQRGCDRKRWVGHDVVRAAWEAEVARISLHDHDGVSEALAEEPGSPWMRLDRDHTGPDGDQRSGEGSETSADVEDGRPRRDVGVTYEPLRPMGIQLMPSPPAR